MERQRPRGRRVTGGRRKRRAHPPRIQARMKPGTLERRILRACRIRARRFARIASLLEYLSTTRSDTRAARTVALRFRKPRRTMAQAVRAPVRLPWIETRLEQHLHFSIRLHGGAVVRQSLSTTSYMP